MGAWGWAMRVPLMMGDDAWTQFPNLKRLCDEISERPAAIRAAALKERHSFHPDFDETARKHMFRFLQ
jgi:GST-like protein